MVPSGKPTTKPSPDWRTPVSGGIVVDGGNSNYKDTVRRAARSRERGCHFRRCRDQRRRLGAVRRVQHDGRRGGGRVKRLAPILEALAPASDKGWGRVGPAGRALRQDGPQRDRIRPDAGVRGRVRADAAKEEFGLDLGRIAEIWRHGSVVRSWLLDLTADALAKNPGLDGIAAFVPIRRGPLDGDRGDRDGVSLPVITMACRPLPVPAGSAVRGQASGRDAQPVRRARGERREGRVRR